jgi:glycosyltransferase involved in cell wall biosynthesis
VRQPFISVIVPTHNRARLLPRALASLVTQSYTDFEVVVVDDASTDETQSLVRAYPDCRIRYVRHESNRRAAAARTTGIFAAQGEYVAFLDSDDEWLPGKLEEQVALIRGQKRIDLVYAGWEWVNEITGAIERSRCPSLDGRIQGLPRWAYNTIPDLIVRRALAIAHPCRNEMFDYDCLGLILPVWRHCSTAYVPRVLVRCYSHSGPRASDGRDRVNYLTQLLEEYADILRSDNAGWAHLNFTAGAALLRHHADHRRARTHLARAVVAKPFKIRQWIYALAALINPSSYPTPMRRVIVRSGKKGKS